MKVDGTLLKELQIFKVVSLSGGLTNAQYPLNKDASAISRAISSLETRLKVVLCERGRKGFKLTREGEAVLAHTKRLFAALEHFEKQILELGDELSGALVLGIIDNIIADPNCPLAGTLKRLSDQRIQGVAHLTMDVSVYTPYELERLLLDQTLDLAIGIFEHRHNALNYIELYQETDALYCSPQSQLWAMFKAQHSHAERCQLLSKQAFFARNFLNQSDIESLGFPTLGPVCYTENLEALTFQIISGESIGFIPMHYAKTFEQRGQLVAIMPSHIQRRSSIQLATRKGDMGNRATLQHIVQCLLDQNSN
ncbi:LysR family transcriptional regulator [Celerinatantimonas sp. YJH-8]|uniref:LysR family transcriptional regulator n=1 Tax=Celerinatantimonas sp. YJH-8 TaxID=3228714 RepID=UPI0038C59253